MPTEFRWQCVTAAYGLNPCRDRRPELIDCFPVFLWLYESWSAVAAWVQAVGCCYTLSSESQKNSDANSTYKRFELALGGRMHLYGASHHLHTAGMAAVCTSCNVSMTVTVCVLPLQK